MPLSVDLMQPDVMQYESVPVLPIKFEKFSACPLVGKKYLPSCRQELCGRRVSRRYPSDLQDRQPGRAEWIVAGCRPSPCGNVQSLNDV